MKPNELAITGTEKQKAFVDYVTIDNMPVWEAYVRAYRPELLSEGDEELSLEGRRKKFTNEQRRKFSAQANDIVQSEYVKNEFAKRKKLKENAIAFTSQQAFEQFKQAFHIAAADGDANAMCKATIAMCGVAGVELVTKSAEINKSGTSAVTITFNNMSSEPDIKDITND